MKFLLWRSLMTRAVLLFDLDGTISDPFEGIAVSINYALERNGCAPLPMAEIAPLIGPPLDESFAKLTKTSEAQVVERLVHAYREKYREVGYLQNRLYEGMTEVIEQLSERGLPMVLCTSKIYEFADKILRHFKLRHHFMSISAGDVGVKKPQQIAKLLEEGVADSSTIMIGDRSVDLSAAHLNGLRAAAVSWGYGTLDELQSEKPEYLLASPSDILKLV
jgi:phosphoglycolate phosphatase